MNKLGALYKWLAILHVFEPRHAAVIGKGLGCLQVEFLNPGGQYGVGLSL